MRGTIPCCCSSELLADSGEPNDAGHGSISIAPGVGDDLEGPDSGYPYPRIPPIVSEEPDGPPDGRDVPSFLDDTARLLLGNGRRCGICWGTGWIDGYHLWGGIRIVCCITDTLYASLNDEGSNAHIDLDAQTPTMMGPSEDDTPMTVSWTLDIPPNFKYLDALRVRDGLRPATGNWSLQATTLAKKSWTDATVAMGIEYGVPGAHEMHETTIPTRLQITLGKGARVSHIELVLRSEPLVNVQMPQIQVTASAELVAPFITEEVELDPVVGYIERGTLLELPGRGGRVGSVWMISDVTVKRDAQGVIFGVVGNARNIQPVDVQAAASLEDALLLGTLDPGLASRGLESTGAGEASGIAGKTDDSYGAVVRKTPQRSGGGAAASRGGIINIGRSLED